MTSDRIDVALLTDPRYTAATAAADDWYLQNILDDDRLIREALARRGITTQRVAWSDETVDWAGFRAAVFRTTWDYFDRFAAFHDWLERVRHQTHLINPYSTIRWNLDKHYLLDLRDRGIPVVPSIILEPGDLTPLHAVLSQQRWTHAVIKPCISGAARHTYRLDPENVTQVEAQIQSLRQAEAFLVQPFQEAITREGEITLMLFGGQFTHGVRKVARAGDFRVQDDFGGTVHDLNATTEQIDLATRIVNCCDPVPSYGRVDLVRDNTGQWAVMELELIEPELWLRRHPDAAEPFAEAIVRDLPEHRKLDFPTKNGR